MLVIVSVVSRPTRVSVEVGSVNVPVLLICEITGVVSVGEVPKTNAPEPVSSVTAAIKFADEGVARNVATLVPNPEIPVATGNPVQLVNVPAEGVPIFGVVREGEFPNTSAPLPVSSVTAAARFAELGVARKVATFAPSPLMPVLTGNPVQLVSVPELGVPRAGVTKVGEVAKTTEPVPVSSVIAAAKFAEEGVARKVATLAPNPLTPDDIGRPVQLVRVPADGVPIFGVVKIGDVRVLFVIVSVVSRPTIVSVVAGSVRVMFPAGLFEVRVVLFPP